MGVKEDRRSPQPVVDLRLNNNWCTLARKVLLSIVVQLIGQQARQTGARTMEIIL
jgi:hypothetical protein